MWVLPAELPQSASLTAPSRGSHTMSSALGCCWIFLQCHLSLGFAHCFRFRKRWESVVAPSRGSCRRRRLREFCRKHSPWLLNVVRGCTNTPTNPNLNNRRLRSNQPPLSTAHCPLSTKFQFCILHFAFLYQKPRGRKNSVPVMFIQNL